MIGKVTSGLDQLESEIVAGGITGGTDDGAPKIATAITAATVQ
ncbi:hypothetical protein GCM10025881_38080 [Pseudolysinimonas kribbensis]|uniref:Variable major outer membrane lipoprotein n=1 Tax=Pseudolysinimonas kribbensis TaxID=433641 RepID=A0ABQ6KCV4_9MICO|nr:hypothetical protein [Pseudolysinimonas kribbensis]GMA96984.1 hypothetical protein GCM10025881_38080 [Pseudolysinimonas kribbensis]